MTKHAALMQLLEKYGKALARSQPALASIQDRFLQKCLKWHLIVINTLLSLEKISISVANKDLNDAGRNGHQKWHSFEWLTSTERKRNHISVSMPYSPNVDLHSTGVQNTGRVGRCSPALSGMSTGAIPHRRKMKRNSPKGTLYILVL